MRIVDAHHHLWDPVANYHPWLRDTPPIPFRYGNYDALRHPFLLPDYDQVSRHWNVVASVTMEGEWDPADPVGEALWMSALAARSGRPAAHVAQAWLDRHDLPAVLERLAQLPLVRSVRHKPAAHGQPGVGQGGMTQRAYIDGFRLLAQSGLHFDLQTPWWHLPELAALVDANPDTRIIINHTGLPADRSPAGLSGWADAMRSVADMEQTVVKISGLGEPGKPWTVSANRDIVLRTIDWFGPARCLFASNFPVDGLCASFDEIYGGFDQITRDFADDERDAMFAGNAARIYGIDLS